MAELPSAHCAITASMPVPAEGSSTTSPGRVAAAWSGGVGERQRGRELLELHLLLGAPGMRGLKRRERFQHGQHAARPAGAGGPAHAAAVALHEDHDGGFRSLVGVLPDPGALGVGRAEGLRHGVPEGRGIEGLSRLQYRQQGAGRGEQGVACDGAVRLGGRIDGDGGRKRTREGCPAPAGRRAWAISVMEGRRAAAGGRREFSRAAPTDRPRPAGRTPAGAARAGGRRRECGPWMRSVRCGGAWVSPCRSASAQAGLSAQGAGDMARVDAYGPQ